MLNSEDFYSKRTMLQVESELLKDSTKPHKLGSISMLNIDTSFVVQLVIFLQYADSVGYS